jgi:hypothetical protein
LATQPGEYIFLFFIVPSEPHAQFAIVASFQQVVPWGSIPLHPEPEQVAANTEFDGNKVRTKAAKIVKVRIG